LNRSLSQISSSSSNDDDDDDDDDATLSQKKLTKTKNIESETIVFVLVFVLAVLGHALETFMRIFFLFSDR